MFGWFKKNSAPKVATKPAKDYPSLPTVKAAPELFECYAAIFRQEMSTIKPFKTRQIEEMLALIESGEGGFLLMRFLNFRAKSLHDRQRRASVGLGEKPMIPHDQDRPFVEMAMKMNPDALPPFFPNDATVMIADMGDLLMKNKEKL